MDICRDQYLNLIFGVIFFGLTLLVSNLLPVGTLRKLLERFLHKRLEKQLKDKGWVQAFVLKGRREAA